MNVRALNANRIAGWLLAMTLVLPSLIGWLPMPMRAQAATMSGSATNAQDATARLLADLAVLCTPYGLRLVGHDQPAKRPVGKLAHDSCVLCGLAAGASLGVLQAIAELGVPAAILDVAPSFAPIEKPRQTQQRRPPSRGPPT